MNESFYRITLDIKSIQSQISLPIKQGDTSRGIYISLTDGGKPYTIAHGCFPVFKGEKSDGTEVGNNCYIENNRIVYPITEQTVASPGIVECEVSLYNSTGGLITSPRFTLIVDSRAVGSDKYKSSSEYRTLENYLSEVRAAEEDRQEVFDYWQNIIKVVDSPKLWELEAGLYKVTTGFYETETTFVNVNSNPEESCCVHIMLNYNGYAFYMRSTYEMVTDADITEQGLCPSFEWGITNGTTVEKGVLQNNSFLVKDSADIETYSKSRNRYPSVRAMYNFVTNKLALKEDLANKVGAITEANSKDGLHYPTVQAVVNYGQSIIKEMQGIIASADNTPILVDETATFAIYDIFAQQGLTNPVSDIISDLDETISIKEGDVFLVSFNGSELKEYVVKSKDDFLYMGNLSIYYPSEDNTGEHFLMAFDEGDLIITDLPEGGYKVSMYKKGGNTDVEVLQELNNSLENNPKAVYSANVINKVLGGLDEISALVGGAE